MWTYGDITVELITLNDKQLFKAKDHGFLHSMCSTVDELQAILGPEIFNHLEEVTTS